MTQQFQREKVDVTAAGLGFIFWGIIYAVAFLIPTILARHDSFWWLFCAAACSGVAMVFVGIGLKKRWRYTLVVAVPLCIFGLFQFPVGTAIFGWALRPLWFARHYFFPFDKVAVP
ncbi:MAG TPA: hypothetical protein VN516_04150 [Candidatus Baltobacteraceae bacterium]|nr:hypothetical protein [Candidatus Baltobacteraceae bacterium]